MKSQIDYTSRFEFIGELYRRDSGRLRPGKDEPMASNRDSSDPENVAMFDEWMATKCFSAVLDRAIQLDMLYNRVLERAEELDQQLYEVNRYATE